MFGRGGSGFGPPKIKVGDNWGRGSRRGGEAGGRGRTTGSGWGPCCWVGASGSWVGGRRWVEVRFGGLGHCLRWTAMIEGLLLSVAKLGAGEPSTLSAILNPAAYWVTAVVVEGWTSEEQNVSCWVVDWLTEEEQQMGRFKQVHSSKVRVSGSHLTWANMD